MRRQYLLRGLFAVLMVFDSGAALSDECNANSISSGLYAGALVGERSVENPRAGPLRRYSLEPDGGLLAGRLWKHNCLAFGIEAEVSKSEVAGVRLGGKLRGGVLVGDSLVYAAAGLSFSKDLGPRVGLYEIGYDAGTINIPTESKTSVFGYLIGAGSETAIANGLRLRIEGQYVRYGDVVGKAQVPLRGDVEEVREKLNDLSLRAALILELERGNGAVGSAPQDWAGLYVALSGEVAIRETDKASPLSALYTSIAYPTNDQIYGGTFHAGYLWQSEAFVFGPELYAGRTVSGFHAGARAKLGYAFRKTLAGVQVGYKQGNGKLQDGSGHFEDGTLERVHGGTEVGAFIDSRITDALSFHFELSHWMSGKERYGFPVHLGRVIELGGPLDASFDDTTVRAGLVWHLK